LLHRFLEAVVVHDPSALRKAEALRCWRRSGGDIDEALLDQLLASPAALDLELRTEAAKVLFTRATPGSLDAQRRLVSTAGVSEESVGAAGRLACDAIQHIAASHYEPAAPDLIAALDDPAPEVRGCAADGLSQITGQSPAFDPEGGKGNETAKNTWRAWWRARSSHSGTAGS
jgi:HEAT repeat protein